MRNPEDDMSSPFNRPADNTFSLPPVGACHVTALRRAARRVSLLYDTVIAPCGLKSSQMGILIHVGRAERPTMGELAASLVLDRSALAENLKPLARKGLVRVHVCATDKRIRRVILTDEGRATLAQCTALWTAAQAQFEDAFGSREADGLRRALSEISSDAFVEAFTR
jgi:DNA-binding MarR family transcriptional regulator